MNYGPLVIATGNPVCSSMNQNYILSNQVFRYPLDGAEEPDLALGERFVPGNDISHFCKPTSTAVDRTGRR